MTYRVVVEQGPHGCSAYVPRLPGCVATGRTPEEAELRVREAIEFHIEGLREDGCPIPEPETTVHEFDPSRQLAS